MRTRQQVRDELELCADALSRIIARQVQPFGSDAEALELLGTKLVPLYAAYGQVLGALAQLGVPEDPRALPNRPCVRTITETSHVGHAWVLDGGAGAQYWCDGYPVRWKA